MNFDFKSTFEQYKTILPSRLKKLIRAGRRHNAALVLLVNVSAFCLMTYFYLENHFIPAVYGSKASGLFWIRLFSFLALVWTITTTYALSALVGKLPITLRLTQWLSEILIRSAERYPVIRTIFLRGLLLFSILIHLINRKQKPLALTFNPKYHNHESKNDPARLG